MKDREVAAKLRSQFHKKFKMTSRLRVGQEAPEVMKVEQLELWCTQMYHRSRSRRFISRGSMEWRTLTMRVLKVMSITRKNKRLNWTWPKIRCSSHHMIFQRTPLSQKLTMDLKFSKTSKISLALLVHQSIRSTIETSSLIFSKVLILKSRSWSLQRIQVQLEMSQLLKCPKHLNSKTGIFRTWIATMTTKTSEV